MDMLKASAIQVYEKETGKTFEVAKNGAFEVDNLGMVWGIYDYDNIYKYTKVDDSGLFVHVYENQSTEVCIYKEMYQDMHTPVAVINDDNNYYIYLISKWVYGDKVGVMRFTKHNMKRVKGRGKSNYKKVYQNKKGTYIIEDRKKVYFTF